MVERSRPGDDDGSFVQAGYGAAIINIGSWPYGDPEYHAEGDIPETLRPQKRRNDRTSHLGRSGDSRPSPMSDLPTGGGLGRLKTGPGSWTIAVSETPND